MRFLVSLTVVAAVATGAFSQEVVGKARFDVLPNPDLYGQKSPQEALRSAITALERERFDYFVAHLLDPTYVDGELQKFQPFFERKASEQLANTAGSSILRGEQLKARIQETATRLNVRKLTDRIREKLADEPTTLRQLQRFAREAEFKEAGEGGAIATLPDVKDRAIYFKKVDGRWYLENRREEAPAPKE